MVPSNDYANDRSPKAIRLELMSQAMENSDVVIGVDVGGTKTHAAAFDRDFKVITDLKVPTLTGGVDQVGAGIISTIATLRSPGQQLKGVGIGLPGIVDRSAGSVRYAFNLGIGDDALHIVSRLDATLSAPCWIANDVDAAALGVFEILRRDDCEIRDLVYLSIGTGIAAGVILDGRIYRGHNGFAGEIGHYRVDPDGPQCPCGLQGCLEAVASGSALSRRWPPSGRRSSVEALFAAADRGDYKAKLILRRTVEHLTNAIHILALTFDVDRIVIGGGVAEVGASFLMDALGQGLFRLQGRSPWTRALNLPDRIMLKPPEPVGVIGAAALTRWSQPV